MSTVAIIAIAAISAVSSIAQGIIQANAAGKAAEANERAQREALNLQRETRDQQRQDQLAQIEIGQAATRTLAGTAEGVLGDEGTEAVGGAVGPGLDRTFEDERADFLVDNGLRAINRRASALGQSFSGAAIEAAGRNETDIRTLSTQREVDQLFRLSEIGSNSASNVGQQATSLTQQSSDSLTDIGDQNAQSENDQGQAFAGAVSGVSGSVTGGITQKFLS